MSSIQINFRPSNIKDKEGTVFYRLIGRGSSRCITTAYRLMPEEWDNKCRRPTTPPPDSHRRKYLEAVRKAVDTDLSRFTRIIEAHRAWSPDEIVAEYTRIIEDGNIFSFMEKIISQLHRLGQVRTAHSYQSALSSFAKFYRGSLLPIDSIDSRLISDYEAYLRRQGLTANTSSFYMRILRAVYNRGIRHGLTPNGNPFRDVYTGVGRTTKRALPPEAIKRIKHADLRHNRFMTFARDMFLFSFYTMGMSFIDMAYLRKCDLQQGILTYHRRKTGQRLTVRWENCMQEIVDRYASISEGEYMLPILRDNGRMEHEQYHSRLMCVNRQLKMLATRMGLDINLTMYVARHSWASIARSKSVPVAVISECMGHGSERTTHIYLSSIDTSTVGKANRTVIKALD